MSDSRANPSDELILNRAVGPVTGRAAAAAGIATIAVWIAGLFGLDVPPEVAAALATLIALIAGWSVDPQLSANSLSRRITHAVDNHYDQTLDDDPLQ